MGRGGPRSVTVCPRCEQALGRLGRGDSRLSVPAKLLFGAGAGVTAIWVTILLMWSPVFLVPRNAAGAALCALFYLGPGVLIGIIAGKLPRIRTLRCRRCGWSETSTLASRPEA